MKPTGWHFKRESKKGTLNTLYLFIFESPESDLDSAWQTGERIMDMLAIDDEF